MSSNSICNTEQKLRFPVMWPPFSGLALICFIHVRVKHVVGFNCTSGPSNVKDEEYFAFCLFHFVVILFSSANATPEFEGRGGEELGTEIANTLYRIFNNESSIDLKLLCINPREHCWVLYVDVLVSKTTLI